MMYKKNFVAAIKVGGKVLRESDDRVELPFGSEYSILLKNLDTVRVQARISIDGNEAVDWVIIGPNTEVHLERFFRKSGSLDQGNRFKFIERSEAVEAHRGTKADDGLVRIEWKREKLSPPPVVTQTVIHNDYYPWSPYRWYPHNYQIGSFTNTQTTTSGGLKGMSVNSSRPLRRGGITGQSVSSSLGEAEPIAVMDSGFNDSMNMTVVANTVGITVPGSQSNQQFVGVAGFECEAPEVIVLHLVGRTGSRKVQVAKTVSQRLVCETCGKSSKSSADFCKYCGTSLRKFGG